MLHSGGVNVFIVYNVSMILITIVTVHHSISMWVLVKAFDPKQTMEETFQMTKNLSSWL